MTILTTPTRLLDELTLDLHLFLDSLTIGHLWRADIGFYAKLPLHSIYNNLEMQLTHAGNDSLSGLLVGTHTERWIFLSQAIQRNAHFFLVDLGFWLYRNMNHRLWKDHPLQRDDVAGIA